MVADYAKRNANLQCTVRKVLRRTKQNKKSTHDCGCLFMARPGGFEPSTYRFVAGHSIH